MTGCDTLFYRYFTCLDPLVSPHLNGIAVAPQVLAVHAGRYLFDDGLESCHGDDGDPDGHEGAQEVTELQHVVLHDAEDHDAGLVACVVELRGGRGGRDSGERKTRNEIFSLSFSSYNSTATVLLKQKAV